MDEKYLTYKQLADRLHLPVGSLYGKVARGEIPHVRFGPRTVRFDEAKVEQWLKTRRVESHAG